MHNKNLKTLVLTVISFILLGLWCFFEECNAIYAGDVVTRMKMKLIMLDRELVLDAIRNVQRVDHLKGYYNKFLEYDIGELLYKIRSKFARMVRIFTLSHDNLHIYNHNKHIKNLLEIQKLAMDIHNFIEMFEEFETNAAKRKNKHSRVPIAFYNQKYKMPKNTTMKLNQDNKKLRMGLSWTISIPRNELHQSKRRENEKDQSEMRSKTVSKQSTIPYKRLEGVGFDTDFY